MNRKEFKDRFDESIREDLRDAVVNGKVALWDYRDPLADDELLPLAIKHARKLLPEADHPRAIAKLVGDRFLKLGRDWHAPPGRPTTPGNQELFAMNVARVTLALGKMRERFAPELSEMEWLSVAAHATEGRPIWRRVVDLLGDFDKRLRERNHREDFYGFALQWLDCSFARLEVGHKLAAALCLTDIDEDVPVAAPWPAWSLILPDGLLPSATSLGRVWILGTEPQFLLAKGELWSPKDPGLDGYSASRWYPLLRQLIRGSCLALSNPDEFRKEQASPSGSSRKSERAAGPPQLDQAKFLLSAPVQVDFREHVAAVASGTSRRGTSPKVQFLVRGHWRRQAHGAGRALRKTIWVQPFWKGPEESRVLLRQHRVEGGS